MSRFIFIAFISIAQISYAGNAPTSVANSFMHDFPHLVLKNCNLIRLTCGKEKLVMKDIMDTWGEQEMEYTTFQGHGIEIRTSDSVDYIDIRNRSISIPHGLNVGEARRKVQEKLGKPYRAWAREGQECMVYKNSEEAIDVQFCSESERIVRILWRAFRAP